MLIELRDSLSAEEVFRWRVAFAKKFGWGEQKKMQAAPKAETNEEAGFRYWLTYYIIGKTAEECAALSKSSNKYQYSVRARAFAQELVSLNRQPGGVLLKAIQYANARVAGAQPEDAAAGLSVAPAVARAFVEYEDIITHQICLPTLEVRKAAQLVRKYNLKEFPASIQAGVNIRCLRAALDLYDMGAFDGG